MKRENVKHHRRHKSHSGIFFGIVLIMCGLLLLLHNIGIDVPFLEYYGTFWPIGLIFVGFFWIIKQKRIGWSILGLMLILGFLYSIGIFTTTGVGTINYEQKSQSIDYEKSVNNLKFDMDFGAGIVSIDSNTKQLFENNYRGVDPVLDYSKSGNDVEISVARGFTSGYKIHNTGKEEWQLSFNDNVKMDMDLSYGAAKMDINIEKLLVDNLNIETGASKTHIRFGNYPTKTEIQTGASSIDLYFPKGTDVIIKAEGLLEKNFDGFTKKDGIYYSKNYKGSGDAIEVDVEGGFVEINTEFY